MLNRMTGYAAACALAVSVLGQCATASETHEVLIVDGAYFPNLIFAQDGDSILFVNSSSDIHEVKAVDDSWTSGVISVGDSYTLELSDQTQLLFTATDDTEDLAGSTGDPYLQQVGEVVWTGGNESD